MTSKGHTNVAARTPAKKIPEYSSKGFQANRETKIKSLTAPSSQSSKQAGDCFIQQTDMNL